MTRKLLAVAVLSLLSVGLLAGAASGASACRSVFNLPELNNSRYEGSDVTAIRASGVSCQVARTFAHRAQVHAFDLPLPPGSIRRFVYRGWSVAGDLRGDVDTYTARKGQRRISWHFS